MAAKKTRKTPTPKVRGTKLPKHALEHLRLSGLTKPDSTKLDLRWLEPAAIREALGTEYKPSCGGILFPYFTSAGHDMGVFRIRFLPNPREGYNVKDESAPKYQQPTGTPPRVYFPKLVTWTRILKSDSPLIITEGEKKAASACASGFPTLGLGGVWNFQRKDLGEELLPDLEAVNWKRLVYIAYDSDWHTNKQVRMAAIQLSAVLTKRGADVRMVILDATDDGAKVGLDDYLVAHGKKALALAIKNAVSLSPSSTEMADYYKQFVLIRSLACAYVMEDGTLHPKHKFMDAYPDEFISDLTAAGKTVQVTKAFYWWKDPRKQSARKMVLKPGEPLITDEGDLNLFKGWGTVPKQGSTAIWAKLLITVFQGDRKSINWFEQWLAYPLQHPGAKLNQAVFVYGKGQGTGKSAIGRIMSDIYGASSRMIQDKEIFADHNSWIANTLFAVGDDLSFDNPRKSRSAIKVLVDGEKVEINPKFVQQYSADNLCNFYLTANAGAALPLDPGGLNRRYLVIKAPDAREYAETWYTGTLNTWRREGGGSEAVHYRLLNLKLNGFDPNGDAPHTQAKDDVVEVGQSRVEAWCADIENKIDYALATRDQLYKLYQNDSGDMVTGIGPFTTALHLSATKLIKDRYREGQHTLWAIGSKLQGRKWMASTPAERRYQFELERGMSPKPLPLTGKARTAKKKGAKKRKPFTRRKVDAPKKRGT